MKGDDARCLAAGMDAYLSKPIEPAELFDVIERLCREELLTNTRGVHPMCETRKIDQMTND
jgi:CheY-like chemotaxis protein